MTSKEFKIPKKKFNQGDAKPILWKNRKKVLNLINSDKGHFNILCS